MGSPLGLAVAKILCAVLKVNGFEIVVMISKLGSIAVISMTYLYCFHNHADKFREYLSSKHSNLKFSIQKEEDGCLPLSGIKVSEYPFKEKRNTLRNIQVLLYTHFYNISLNILRPNFFNIYNLPILHFPNIGKIRVKVGPKLTTFPTL